MSAGQNKNQESKNVAFFGEKNIFLEVFTSEFYDFKLEFQGSVVKKYLNQK